MKVNKKIFICALLLLTMLCAVSAASATEPLNDNLTATDAGGVVDDVINEDLSISEAEDELSAEGDTITVDCNGGGDYTTISDAVGAATGGETIFIKNGEYTVDTKVDIGSKSLSFIGESNGGVIIKSTPTNTAIIETTEAGVNLKLENLVFKDSSATSTGIINFGNYESTGNLDVINCTFENCISKNGMLYVKTLGDATISGVKIYNCNSTVSKGANAIYVQYKTNNLNIIDVVIDGCNYVSSGGYSYGVIYLNADVSNGLIENVTITNCGGNIYGIINSKGNVIVRNSKIINNQLSGSTNDLFRSNNPGALTIEQNIIANNTCGRIFYSNQASSATTNTVLTANYNNIANNTYSSIYSGSTGCELDLENNYWGANTLPEGVTASSWIVEEEGVYKYNDGSDLDVIIPGLNDGGDEPEVEYDIYVDCYAADGGDGSKTNPFKSISEAVGAATGGETIFIKNGEYTESGKISLSKSLSFIGESQDGVIITSSATNQGIFEMIQSGVVLSFNQLTFSNVNAGTGSNLPIKIGGDSNVDIINCSFIGCTSKFGAIQLYTTGNATVADCTIKDFKSSASAGTGGIYLSSNGIYNIKNTVIDNSIYTGSTGYMYGIIYVAGKTSETTLENVTISNCKGVASSVIYTKAKTTLKNSKIINNTVEPSATGYQGESVFYTNYNANNNPNAELIIEQTIIADNVGPNAFVYANSNSAKTTINYCNIQNNTYGTTFATTNGNFDFEYNYWGSNDAPTDPTVTRYAIMDSEGHFTDDQGNALEKEIPVLEDVGGDEPAVLDVIYVSDSGSDDNEGSMSAPVKTIQKAIELAQKGKIVILPGTYTLTETLSIVNDLDIEGRGNVLISGNVQLLCNSANLNLTNIKFNSAAVVNGAVVTSTGDLNIDSCVFNVNAESGNAIYIDGGNANIANSVLLNPAGYALVASSAPSTITANNNWWGKNGSANANVEIASWIVMDAGVDLAKINAGDEVTITVSFNKTNDGSDYAGSLPEFNVTVVASNLNEEIAVKNNKASVKYTVNADDEATVTSGSEQIVVPLKLYEAPEIIYVDALNGVDTNDGDEAHPVQTIAKAIELAVKGKIVILEGTYTIDSTLTVNNDLDIKGEGTVIIDGNSKRILTNNANLNITNVQFTNGFDSSAVIVNNANLTLNSTLFYSNVNLNGYGASVVRNNKKLIIDNSKFYENKERYGNIYNNNGAELLINNSEFYDNDVTAVTTVATGIALYSDGGNAVIENSKFYNNKGNFSVIYFLSKDSLSATSVNNLTITNCIFDSNELVRYGVIYSQKANTTIKDSTFTNNVVKKSSMANGEGSAIYVNGEKVTVETSVFKNNNAADSGKDIYVYAGELDISDSVLINANGYSIEKTESAIVTANDNWWGNNTPNTPVDVERWVVMSLSSNDTDIQIGDEIKVIASFDKTNNGDDYTGDLPEAFDVTFTSTSGNLNEVKAVENKKAEVTYTVDQADREITATSDAAVESLTVNRILDIIYVSTEGSDDNDGDRDTPVATLAKAIELAQKGQIVIFAGTYKTGDLGTISDMTLNITGEGKVIIDADNNNRILYVGNQSKLVLKNLILINGLASASSEESGALLGNNGDLTLINCTLANSTSQKNGGAIFNARNLTVINSTFENNVAEKNGGAIFTQKSGVGSPKLVVSNSRFKNNTAKGQSNYGGGAIYVQQSDEAVLIEDSIFEDNKCYDYGGGAIEIAQTNVATINNCTFINNSANGEDHRTKSDFGGGAISFKGYYDSVRETLTVTNSLFIDNSVSQAGGGAIYAMYSTVDVKNSVLINNGDKNGVSVYGRDADMAPAKITANDNWWGSNDDPKSSINRGTLTRWAVLTVTNDSAIIAGQTVKLTVSINQYTTGSVNGTLEEPIKVERPVSIYTNLGNIEGTLVNGEFSTDYLVPEGLKIITANVDSESQVLYVLTTGTNVEIENITGLMGDRVEYTIKVTSTDGSTVTTGSVELYFGDSHIMSIPVSNGEATSTVIISKEPGIYTITAKFVDPTEEFENSESTATLNVTGIDNIVTPQTIGKFFNDDGVIKHDLPFTELIFQGEFNDLGTLVVNKHHAITGDGALFNNTALYILGDGVTVKNIEFVADKEFDKNAVIYIEGKNALIENNTITYDAPIGESYAVYVDGADGTRLIENDIFYDGKLAEGTRTMAIFAIDSDNMLVSDNYVEAKLPSVDVGYGPAPDYASMVLSAGIEIESCKNLTFEDNTVTVDYNGTSGYSDTLYGLRVTGSDDASIIGNVIGLNGHSFAYGVEVSGKNVTLEDNIIESIADGHYAAGVAIQGQSTVTLNGNDITAESEDVGYGIYADNWNMYDSSLEIVDNTIEVDSNTAYGMSLAANETEITDNDVTVNGNYTIGIGVKNANATIKDNIISASGSNVGESADDYPMLDPMETLGIYAENSNVDIENNNVTSTSKKTISLNGCNGTIVNNRLVANGARGDATISLNNSNVKIDNNKASEDSTPSKDVIKVVASNAKVDYGFTYKVRVTINGKSVGAGKVVTLKIAGKTLKAKTDKNGYAKFTLKVKPKKYTAKVTYNKVSKTVKVTVKNVIKAKNKTIKKSAKKVRIKVTLKTSKKKPIKGKKITLKIKGKKLKAKTNKKGVATFKLKKGVLKKLKAGKKYKYKVIYGKDIVKKTLKVKR